MLQSSIEAIIVKMPKGRIFDSHTVIQFLREKHPEVYLQAYQGEATVKSFHSRLAKEIEAFTQPEKGELIKRVGNAWSKNIHNNYSTCACWQKK